MALTDQDKKWIKGAIVEGVNEAYEVLFAPRFNEIDKRFDRIDNDIHDLKERVAALEAGQRDIIERLGSVEGEIEALTNDIKEIYSFIYKRPNGVLVSDYFAKMSSNKKISVLNEELLKIAKHMNIKLSR